MARSPGNVTGLKFKSRTRAQILSPLMTDPFLSLRLILGLVHLDHVLYMLLSHWLVPIPYSLTTPTLLYSMSLDKNLASPKMVFAVAQSGLVIKQQRDAEINQKQTPEYETNLEPSPPQGVFIHSPPAPYVQLPTPIHSNAVPMGIIILHLKELQLEPTIATSYYDSFRCCITAMI